MNRLHPISHNNVKVGEKGSHDRSLPFERNDLYELPEPATCKYLFDWATASVGPNIYTELNDV